MSNKVLVVDDDRFIQRVVQDSLKAENFVVNSVRSCRDAEVYLVKDLPDIILLDVVLPDDDGFNFLRQLRNNTRTSHLPIIMLTSKNDVVDKVHGLNLGADDYITKPFDLKELAARVKTNIRRSKQINQYNPLTGLPGNILIEEKIGDLLVNKIPFSICYVDLDNFKSYNDVYGFIKGDEVIKMVAGILKESTEAYGGKQDFVGHIGGDDYVLLTSPEVADRICQDIINSFDFAVPLLYDEQDRKKGYITTLDRDGIKRDFPIMTLSIAVVDCKGKNFEDVVEVTEIAAMTKKVAKEIPHSNYIRYAGG